MYISDIVTTVPDDVQERVPLEQAVYQVFTKLGIPFWRVDNEPASSMEECSDIGKVLGAPVRKDVFLCNQKKTSFFPVSYTHLPSLCQSMRRGSD